jgi:hypothetical protein
VSAPSVRPFADVLLQSLRAVHPRVGDAEAPADDAVPYAVLWPLSVGLGGPVVAQHDDAVLGFQLTCVGAGREQAQWLADRLRPVMLSRLAVPGRYVSQAWLEASQPVRRDDDVTPALFYVVEQFRYATFPS